MLIRVLEVLEPGRVRVAYHGGEAVADWRGAAPALAGRDYLVEVDVDGELVWDGDVLRGVERGGASLSVTVEDAGATGLVDVRIGSSLSSLELADDQRLPSVGSPVELRDVRLSVWPTQPSPEPEPQPVQQASPESTPTAAEADPPRPLVRRRPSWRRALVYLALLYAATFAFVWLVDTGSTVVPRGVTALAVTIVVSELALRRLARADRQTDGLLREYPVQLDAERTGVGRWWSRAVLDRSVRARGVLAVDRGRAEFVPVPAGRGQPWSGPVHRAEVVRGRLTHGLRLHGPAGTAQLLVPGATTDTYRRLARWLPFDPEP